MSHPFHRLRCAACNGLILRRRVPRKEPMCKPCNNKRLSKARSRQANPEAYIRMLKNHVNNCRRYTEETRVAPNFGNSWTDKDRQFLVENVGKIKIVDMAKHIGRTYYATVQMLRELRSKK